MLLSGVGCGAQPDNVVAVYDGGTVTQEEMEAYLRSGLRPRLRGDAAASEEEGIEQLTRFYAAEKILASQVEDAQAADSDQVLYLDTRARALVRFYIDLVGKKSYEIPDEKLHATYHELLDSRFTLPEKVKFQHVFLRRDRHTASEARALLASIQERLRTGASMEDMVSAYSESGTKVQDGIVGPVFRGKMDMEFEEQVFDRGNTTEAFVVETANGFHLVRILHHSERRVMDFEEARPQIVSMLVGERTNAERQEIFARLRERYDVEIVEDWRSLETEEAAVRVAERSLSRGELEAFLNDRTRLSLRRDIFEPELEEDLIRDLVDSNLMYLDAVERGLDRDPVFAARWDFRIMRTRAGVARRRQFEEYAETLTDDEVRVEFEAEPERYFSPPRREVSYLYVPFLDTDPFERLKLAEGLAEMLRDQLDRDEIVRLSEANDARFVELGVLAGHQIAGLGPDAQRALVTMGAHQVSEPIRVAGGVVVLAQGQVWERRPLQLPEDVEAIRHRHAELHRNEFMHTVDDRVLEERGFRMLSSELFLDDAPQPAAEPTP